MNEAVLILFLLAIKHGVCDLALQALYCRPSHKHIYLAPKAMLHSLHHGIGTWVVLMMFTNYLTAISLAILDMVLHHNIDFVKSSVVKKKKFRRQVVLDRNHNRSKPTLCRLLFNCFFVINLYLV